MKIKISDHAVDRYRERVGPLPAAAALAKLEIFGRLADAKPKHIRRLREGKRTTIVPVNNCMFVFEGTSMVTVLERKPA